MPRTAHQTQRFPRASALWPACGALLCMPSSWHVTFVNMDWPGSGHRPKVFARKPQLPRSAVIMQSNRQSVLLRMVTCHVSVPHRDPTTPPDRAVAFLILGWVRPAQLVQTRWCRGAVSCYHDRKQPSCNQRQCSVRDTVFTIVCAPVGATAVVL